MSTVFSWNKVTSYHIYRKDKYAGVTFDKNGGDSDAWVNHDIVEKGKTFNAGGGNLPAENPKKASHTFLGWAKSPNATASDFDNNTTVNGDMKVYAVWKKNLNEVPLNASGNVYAKLDREVETIEGFSCSERFEILSDAFADLSAVQCGFCMGG